MRAFLFFLCMMCCGCAGDYYKAEIARMQAQVDLAHAQAAGIKAVAAYNIALLNGKKELDQARIMKSDSKPMIEITDDKDGFPVVKVNSLPGAEMKGELAAMPMMDMVKVANSFPVLDKVEPDPWWRVADKAVGAILPIGVAGMIGWSNAEVAKAVQGTVSTVSNTVKNNSTNTETTQTYTNQQAALQQVQTIEQPPVTVVEPTVVEPVTVVEPTVIQPVTPIVPTVVEPTVIQPVTPIVPVVTGGANGK